MIPKCSSCGGDLYHYAGCGVGEHGERIAPEGVSGPEQGAAGGAIHGPVECQPDEVVRAMYEDEEEHTVILRRLRAMLLRAGDGPQGGRGDDLESLKSTIMQTFGYTSLWRDPRPESPAGWFLERDKPGEYGKREVLPLGAALRSAPPNQEGT